jgi:hypothetical protein
MKWTGIIDANGVDKFQLSKEANYTYLNVRSQARKYRNAMVFEVELKRWQSCVIDSMLSEGLNYGVAALLHDPDFVEQLEVQAGQDWHIVPNLELDKERDVHQRMKVALHNMSMYHRWLQKLRKLRTVEKRVKYILHNKKATEGSQALHDFSVKKGWGIPFIEHEHLFIYQYEGLPDADPPEIELDMDFIADMLHAGGIE